MRKEGNQARTDIYERITGTIIAELDRGVRPWMKPWSGRNADGRITRVTNYYNLPAWTAQVAG